MKQMFKFFVAIAAITAGFASCSSEEVIPSGTDTLDRSNLTIVLNNSGAATKAIDDANSVAAETAIKSISVFVFGAATKAEADTIFLDGVGPNSFADGGVDKYTATYYSVPVGSKQVYVGVNLTKALHDAIVASGVSAVQTWANLDSLKTLYPATGGFPMFSDGTKSPVYTIVKGQTNTIETSVKRLVAKVTVETEQAFEDDADKRTANGMTIDKNIEFALGQLNTKVYPYPQVGNVDPNYDGSAYLGDFVNTWSAPTVFDNFKAVTKAADLTPTIDMTKFQASYAPENTHATKRTGEMTYVAVKAKFKPEFLHTYTNQVLDYTAYANESLATVYVFNNGGKFLYFINQADADLYKADSQLEYETYTDGTCFYTVYLNTALVNGVRASGNVLRNEYYKVAVQGIAKIGKPNPGPSDPEEELDAKVDIEVKITVQDWSKVDQPTILGE
jgi:hypothetical protein